jgi:hypothetical protein
MTPIDTNGDDCRTCGHLRVTHATRAGNCMGIRDDHACTCEAFRAHRHRWVELHPDRVLCDICGIHQGMVS